MDGSKITIGVIYGLFVFTLMIIIKSDSTWKAILPFMILLALAYILILVATTLLMLALLKIFIDLIEFIYDAYNLPEGMFFFT